MSIALIWTRGSQNQEKWDVGSYTLLIFIYSPTVATREHQTPQESLATRFTKLHSRMMDGRCHPATKSMMMMHQHLFLALLSSSACLSSFVQQIICAVCLIGKEGLHRCSKAMLHIQWFASLFHNMLHHTPCCATFLWLSQAKNTQWCVWHASLFAQCNLWRTSLSTQAENTNSPICCNHSWALWTLAIWLLGIDLWMSLGAICCHWNEKTHKQTHMLGNKCGKWCDWDSKQLLVFMWKFHWTWFIDERSQFHLRQI